MDARCRIELLGGLKVSQGERIITRFRTRQTGALLAYLAYHLGRHLSREVVIEALWPDVEARTGRNNLSIALNSLRSQLEPPGVPAGAVLLSDRFSVSLNPAAVVTDVAEFLAALQAAQSANEDAGCNAALRQAIDLYHGELLPGFYDEWVMQERHRLQALFEQAEEGLNHLAPHLPSSAALPAVAAPTLPASQPGPHNIHLPLQFTPFFGREEELGLLGRWCVGKPEDKTHPLVTLTGSGEETAFRRRHRDYFLRLAEQAEPILGRLEIGNWMERLEIEHDNFRAALDWCESNVQEAEAGLRLAGALFDFWDQQGDLREARARLESALANDVEAPAVERGKVLAHLGWCCLSLFDYEAARRHFEANLALSRELGHHGGAQGVR